MPDAGMQGIAAAVNEDSSVLQPGAAPPKLTITPTTPATIKAFVGNRAIELPPDQAQKALMAGTIKLPNNQPLHVRAPDGSYQVVPPDQVNQALADGGALVSAAEHHQADLAAKYDTGVGSGILATGLGVARGLSTVPGGGSISDALVGLAGTESAIRGGTGDPEEDVQYLLHHRAGLSGVGEVGGMLAQAALMPGGGLGGLAEHGVEAAAGEGLAARLVGQSVKAGIENAQLAHTDMVSEEALGDPDVTAEKYFATIGKSALFGAAAGAGGALLGEGVKAARGAIFSKAGSAADLDGVAEKAFGEAPKVSGVGEALVKVQALLSGADAEGMQAIREAGPQNLSAAARELRKTAQNISDVRAGAVKTLTADLNEHMTNMGALTDELKGEGKLGQFKSLVSSPLPEPELASHVRETMQDVRNRVTKMIDDRNHFGFTRDLKGIDQQLIAHEKNMVQALERNDQSAAFGILDQVKRDLGGWGRKFSASAQQGTPLASQQAGRVFRELGDMRSGGGIYEDLRKNLEDETTWGKAGAAQKALNADWTEQIAAEKALHYTGASLTTQVGETNFGRKVFAVDPTKMDTYVAGLVNPANDLKHQAMARYVAATGKLADTIGQHFDLDPAKKALVDRMKASSGRLTTGLDDIGTKLTKVNRIQALVSAGMGGGGLGAQLLGHVAGAAIGGTIGAVVSPDDRGTGAAVGGMLGMGLGVLGSPGKNIMRLAQLEGAVSSLDAKMGGALSRFFGRARAAGAEVGQAGAGNVSRGTAARVAGKVASRAAREIGSVGSDVVHETEPGVAGRIAKEIPGKTRETLVEKSAERGHEDKEKSTREEFEANAKAVTALHDPAVLTGKLQPHFEALQGSAPQTAKGLGGTAAMAVAYLTTKLPDAPPADPLTGKPGQPSASEMSLYNVRVRAVKDPAGVVDDLARGRVTTEQVETLQAVYPGIYRELQQKAQQSLLEHAQAGHPLPFQQRVALGVLLGIDSDPSLAKPAMGHAMATFGKPPAPPPKGSGSGHVGPSAISRDVATPEQRMSQGGV